MIVQFDSELHYITAVDIILSSVGLKVSDYALGKGQAERLIQKLQAGKEVPELAIIDTLIDRHHQEGSHIAKLLKQLYPEIKIIAYTILAEEKPDWADFHAVKSLRDPSKTIAKALGEALQIDLKQGREPDVS
jgi:hypothetical protein